MSKPILLDLYAGAGGATRGYQDAGFTVVGVDVKAQPRYVGEEFYQGDALEYLATADLSRFDAIHASPPCQEYSTTRVLHRTSYPRLIGPTRDALKRVGLPYVIENVVGAPLRTTIQLCGSSFGLGVRRHRRFETTFLILAPSCRHELQPEPIDVTGTGGPGGRHRKPASLEEARHVMGIDWMTRTELSEAIPPAYSKFVGAALMAHLRAEATA